MTSITMNCDPRLCRHFIQQAKSAISSRPEIENTWSIDADEDHCIWEIRGKGNPGYDIIGEVHPSEIMLSAEGWHEHYPLTEPMDDFVSGMLGRIRDMMSPAMRIREVSSNGTPFRWCLENAINGSWKTESDCSLFFWNWFGKRTERNYSSTLLPVRENRMIS
jgi:hypothetical protein